jgi:hypothetical protein
LVVVGGVGEATNATGLPTAARRSTQRFGDLTFGISLVLLHISAINMALRTAIFLPSRMKKRNYNPTCVEDEVSIRDILSEESRNTSSESECESETSVVCVDG